MRAYTSVSLTTNLHGVIIKESSYFKKIDNKIRIIKENNNEELT